MLECKVEAKAKDHAVEVIRYRSFMSVTLLPVTSRFWLPFIKYATKPAATRRITAKIPSASGNWNVGEGFGEDVGC